MNDSISIAALTGEPVLAITALGLLLLGAFKGNKRTKSISHLSVISILGVFLMLWATSSFMRAQGIDSISTIGSMVIIDPFSLLMKMLIALALAASIAISTKPPDYNGSPQKFEHPILVLLAGIGMFGMVSANNFLSLYICMEMQAIALYILVASGNGAAKSAEAGVKYFLLGALSSGLMLFGIAFIYGASGSLDYSTIKNVLSNAPEAGSVVGIGMAFLLAGLAFKLSLVPFHMWTPDVYDGSPTRVTALLAIAPKIAALGALARILFIPLEPLIDSWLPILILLSVASMTLGAISGIAQKSLKRLMAYSTIGNIGYMMLGVIAGGTEGLGAAIFYIAIYSIMTAGVFVVILSMRRDGREMSSIGDLSGAARHSPWRAGTMAVLMFSMAGMPPFAGFFAKLLVFTSLVDINMTALAVYGIATSVIAAFYYLRVIKVMYFDDAGEPFDNCNSTSRKVVLGISIAITVGLILIPDFGLEIAKTAAASLF